MHETQHLGCGGNLGGDLRDLEVICGLYALYVCCMMLVIMHGSHVLSHVVSLVTCTSKVCGERHSNMYCVVYTMLLSPPPPLQRTFDIQ